MSELQRNFSFQTHDDDPAYHPIDHASNSPRRPMSQNLQPSTDGGPVGLGENRSYGAGDGQTSGANPNAPTRDWEAYRQSPQPGNSPTRIPSGSEGEPQSTGGAQWREPEQREDDNEYYIPSPQARTSITRKPVAVGMGAGGEPAPATAGGEVVGEGEGGPVNSGVGGYQEDERYWGPGLGYPQSNRNSGYHAVGGEYYENRGSPQHPVSQGSSSPSPLYPPTLSSPSSQVPLVDRTPQPPAHGLGAFDDRPSDRVLSTPVGGHYTDNPYNRYSTTWDPVLSSTQVQVDGTPDTYVQSDDEDETYRRGQAAGAAGAAAASGGALAALGARVGRPAPSQSYNGGGTGSGYDRGGLLGGSDVSSGNINNEKVAQSEWLKSQNKSRKKTKWIVGILILVVLLCVAGGTSAGIILTRKGSKGSSGGSSTGSANGGGGSGLSGPDDIRQNGDLNADSAEIKALMSNTKLKKVFHGMDYTPLNAVFPECLQNPPTQNNITRDIAVMSRLTNKLRLYGTDCNQTEMVLHAIEALKVDMKVWLGVWLDNNVTTNTRQLGHLYKLLDQYPSDRFEGVAVGNEVLFRKDLTSTQLFSIIDDVRHNLTSLKINLPVGTSDLGSNWKVDMVSSVDVLMANVHPFFAGVTVTDAANWTYSFFQDNDVILTAGLTKKPRVMISEVGWPSGGGSDLGSVAGINEMNIFMKDFICKENSRGTEYFWFSAFDEPWKVRYNEPSLGKEWEDKWGLMDVNRNLKDGLVIPDCT